MYGIKIYWWELSTVSYCWPSPFLSDRARRLAQGNYSLNYFNPEQNPSGVCAECAKVSVTGSIFLLEPGI